MKSNEMMIDSFDNAIDSVVNEVENVAAYCRLDAKQSMRLQLLAEELIGVGKGVMGRPTGVFYVETTGDEIALCLSIKANVDYLSQEKFLELSKSGKNEATKGIGGKIRYIVNWMFSGDSSDYIGADDSVGVYTGLYRHNEVSMYDMGWSLANYKGNSKNDKEVWDELEMSIIGKLADDVLVGASSNRVDIKIIKKM